MGTGALGKLYQDGGVIVRQGEAGNCMYVIQEGQVEVLLRKGDKDVCVAVLGEGDFFGEMALFDQEVRSATVRARGEVKALTLEKRLFSAGSMRILHWLSGCAKRCPAALGS